MSHVGCAVAVRLPCLQDRGVDIPDAFFAAAVVSPATIHVTSRTEASSYRIDVMANACFLLEAAGLLIAIWTTVVTESSQ